MFERKAKVILKRNFTGAIPLSACSACAGDYEDPDQTAPDGFEAGQEGPFEDDNEFSASQNE
jgi:hypothetical protein